MNSPGRRGRLLRLLAVLAAVGAIAWWAFGVRDDRPTGPGQAADSSPKRDAVLLQGSACEPQDTPAPIEPSPAAEPYATVVAKLAFLGRRPASVKVVAYLDAENGNVAFVEREETPTNNVHELRLDLPTAGRVELEANADGERHRLTPRGGVAVTLGETTDLGTTQFGAPAFRIRVVDDETGTPVPDTLAWLRDGAKVVASLRSNVVGRMYAKADGIEDRMFEIRPPAKYRTPAQMRLQPSAEELEIRLHALPSIRVRAHWQGKQVSDVFVAVQARRRSGAWSVPRRDAAGGFRVEPDVVEIVATHEYVFGRSPLGQAKVSPGSDVVDVSMDRAPHDATGLAEFELGPVAKEGPFRGILLAQSGEISGRVEQRTFTAPDGVLRIPLPPGAYEFQAGRADETTGFLSERVRVRVVSDKVTPVRVPLERAIEVRVLSSGHVPAHVELSSQNEESCWLAAHQLGGCGVLMRPSERLSYGVEDLRLFVRPGAWEGTVHAGDDTRAFRIEGRGPHEARPWDKR